MLITGQVLFSIKYFVNRFIGQICTFSKKTSTLCVAILLVIFSFDYIKEKMLAVFFYDTEYFSPIFLVQFQVYSKGEIVWVCARTLA